MGKKDKKNKQTEDPTVDKLIVDQNESYANTGTEQDPGAKKSTDEDVLVTLAKENIELKDKYLRLRAEFENFRRRTLKEKLDDRKLAKKDIMTELLPILDDFDRANKVAIDNKAGEPISEGMRLVHQKLINTVTQQGLEGIDSTDDVFDPEIHEAIAEIPAPTEALKGKVIDTVEKGYKLNGIIIRHPKVVVAK